MKATGSCHCGNVKFEAEGDFSSAMACNCSICARKGSLLAFVPRSSFKLLTPESNTRGYQFNKHVIDHRFCTNCGMHPFAWGQDAKGNLIAAINVRCLDDFDESRVKVSHFDGRSK